ncbi:hypothetical protein [Streptomyces sp. JV190]|nr:hypothetical protein [Streptomyces sp. JV190]MEE1840205.1 hypothetical protein [Streptomyces sp. JV190]
MGFGVVCFFFFFFCGGVWVWWGVCWGGGLGLCFFGGFGVCFFFFFVGF